MDKKYFFLKDSMIQYIIIGLLIFFASSYVSADGIGIPPDPSVYYNISESQQIAVIDIKEENIFNVDMFISLVDNSGQSNEITFVLPFYDKPNNFHVEEETYNEFNNRITGTLDAFIRRNDRVKERVRDDFVVFCMLGNIGIGSPISILIWQLGVFNIGGGGEIQPEEIIVTEHTQVEVYNISDSNILRNLLNQLNLSEEVKQKMLLFDGKYLYFIKIKTIPGKEEERYFWKGYNSQGIHFSFVVKAKDNKYIYPLSTGNTWQNPIPLTRVYVKYPNTLVVNVSFPTLFVYEKLDIRDKEAYLYYNRGIYEIVFGSEYSAISIRSDNKTLIMKVANILSDKIRKESTLLLDQKDIDGEFQIIRSTRISRYEVEGELTHNISYLHCMLPSASYRIHEEGCIGLYKEKYLRRQIDDRMLDSLILNPHILKNKLDLWNVKSTNDPYHTVERITYLQSNPDKDIIVEVMGKKSISIVEIIKRWLLEVIPIFILIIPFILWIFYVGIFMRKEGYTYKNRRLYVDSIISISIIAIITFIINLPLLLMLYLPTTDLFTTRGWTAALHGVRWLQTLSLLLLLLSLISFIPSIFIASKIIKRWKKLDHEIRGSLFKAYLSTVISYFAICVFIPIIFLI